MQHAAADATATTITVLRVQDVEAKYYANGEDAYEMRKYFGSGTGKRKSGKKGSSADNSSTQQQQPAVTGTAQDKQAAVVG